jgi:hypothetical protein
LVYLLFCLYLIACSWLLTKIKFVQTSTIDNTLVIFFFLLKVLAGVGAGLLYAGKPGVDTWIYHNESLIEYDLLLHQPKTYFTNLFYSVYEHGYAGFFSSENSFWNDLKTNLIVKILSVFNVFSFGNYYVNVILFNFFVMLGSVALFRVFQDIYRNNRITILFGVFLLPSILFFGSTVHKDGIVFSSLAVILYFIYNLLQNKKFRVRDWLIVLFSFSLIFFFRSFVLIILFPFLVAWILSVKLNKNPYVVSIIGLSISALVLFTIDGLLPSFNPLQVIINKKEAFLSLEKAKSFVDTGVLVPTLKSFLINFPDAFIMGVFRPFLLDGKMLSFLYPLAIELLFYQVLFLLMIIYPKNQILKNSNPFVLFTILFTLTWLLFAGYTVPIVGAIVRYRAIYLPFLVIPILCNIDWNRVLRLLRIK